MKEGNVFNLVEVGLLRFFYNFYRVWLVDEVDIVI